MKTFLPFLVCATIFAQSSSSVSGPASGKTAAIDKAKVEEYLRHMEAWPSVVAVKIDDPAPSAVMPGYDDLAVHLSYNQAKLDVNYFISPDGQKIIKGNVFDLSKSPFQDVLDKIKTDHQPSYGPADAPITLVEFGDFECPYCKQEASTLRQQLPAAFPGKVRVFFLDYPLESIHPWSRAAALGGRCVYRQGEDAFWKYHDWIYAHQEEVNKDNYNAKLSEFASQAGLDPVQLGRCVDSKSTAAEVDRTEAIGRSLGVDGTPTLYLAGRKLIDQTAQWNTMQQLIQLELDHETKAHVATAKEDSEKCCVAQVPKAAAK